MQNLAKDWKISFLQKLRTRNITQNNQFSKVFENYDKILLENRSLLRRLQKLELESNDLGDSKLLGVPSTFQRTPSASQQQFNNFASGGASPSTLGEEEEKNFHKKLLQAQREKAALVEDFLRVTDALSALEKMKKDAEMEKNEWQKKYETVEIQMKGFMGAQQQLLLEIERRDQEILSMDKDHQTTKQKVKELERLLQTKEQFFQKETKNLRDQLNKSKGHSNPVNPFANPSTAVSTPTSDSAKNPISTFGNFISSSFLKRVQKTEKPIINEKKPLPIPNLGPATEIVSPSSPAPVLLKKFPATPSALKKNLPPIPPEKPEEKIQKINENKILEEINTENENFTFKLMKKNFKKKLINLDQPKAVKNSVDKEKIYSLKFSPDNSLISVGTSKNCLRILETGTLSEVNCLNFEFDEENKEKNEGNLKSNLNLVSKIKTCFSSDSETIFGISNNLELGEENFGNLFIWNAFTGEKKGVFKIFESFENEKNVVSGMHWLDSKNQIVLSSMDGCVKFWDVEKQICSHSFNLPANFQPLDFTIHQNHTIVACSDDGFINHFDSREEKKENSKNPKKSDLFQISSNYAPLFSIISAPKTPFLFVTNSINLENSENVIYSFDLRNLSSTAKKIENRGKSMKHSIENFENLQKTEICFDTFGNYVISGDMNYWSAKVLSTNDNLMPKIGKKLNVSSSCVATSNSIVDLKQPAQTSISGSSLASFLVFGDLNGNINSI